MPLLEQIEDILRLLEEAKDDLEAWVTLADEDGYDVDFKETQDLIAEIRSTLHDVGY